MFFAFLIMLREGIEAALIVGIVAGFLKQSGYGHMMSKVWLGVGLAALMCVGLGWLIYQTTGEIPQKQQELVVGIIGLVAVGLITYMVLWMQKAAKSMKGELQESVSEALKRGEEHGWALVGMAFLAVAREGLESVFFLIAVFQQSETAALPIGAVAGVVCAAIIGWLIYQGGIRINLARFFRWTGVFLIFVAAGLFAGAFRALHEAGVWNVGQEVVVHLNHVLHEDSPLGVVLGGFLGYTDHPTVSDFVLYFLYLIPVLWLFWRGNQTVLRKAA